MIHEPDDSTLTPTQALLRLFTLEEQARAMGVTNASAYEARRLALAERALSGRPTRGPK